MSRTHGWNIKTSNTLAKEPVRMLQRGTPMDLEEAGIKMGLCKDGFDNAESVESTSDPVYIEPFLNKI
jgi:hypothetical protein